MLLVVFAVLAGLATAGRAGRTLEFRDVDIAISPAATPPASGWRRIAVDDLPGAGLRAFDPTAPRTAWARMRFDRRSLGAGPLAILTNHNIDRFDVRLNGVEIFTNHARPSDSIKGFYRPVEIGLRESLVRAGANEILVRVNADAGAVPGFYEVGPADDISRAFRYQTLWRLSGVRATGVGVATITGLAGLLWLMRRRETELLFLTLYGVLICVDDANLVTTHYGVPIVVFHGILDTIIYFEMAAALSYCLIFFRHPNAGQLWRFLFGAAALCAGLQIALAWSVVAFVAINALALAIVLYVCAELYRVRDRSKSDDLILFVILFVIFVVGSVHDIVADPVSHLWGGLGFYTSNYDGFLFSAVFLYTLARRASHAFDALETANQTLRDRVDQARRDLMASETRRRRLEVASAVEGERERVMREIHDGIGANLVSALSAARGQAAPDIAVRTLERALLDLKMTVDSLEPLDGDVVLLLASFRHRIGPDLEKSGVACRWEAGDCRAVAWLDAPNALHLLRLYQEAFSNILAHSGADAIHFGCRPEPRGARDGVLTFVEDNGRGFAADAPTPGGRGLGNMRARATSIHAEFDVASRPGAGTRIAVWLPYER